MELQTCDNPPPYRGDEGVCFLIRCTCIEDRYLKNNSKEK